MSFSAFDHPYLGGLLGDEEIARHFSAEADVAAMLHFEAALAKAEAAQGLIPLEAAARIAEAAAALQPDIERLRIAVSVDGVVVPELMRQLRQAVGEPHARHVHFGATSQDVIDTSLMLRLKPVLAVLETRLIALLRSLADLNERFGSNALMAHTRMQPAIAILVSDRVAAWDGHRCARCRTARARPSLQICRSSSAVRREAWTDWAEKPRSIRALLAQELGLADAPQWHSQRDRLADLANILSLITGALGKFGQDIALLAQAGGEIELAGGGGSSAMPHKQNPVAAETLVALARFNATQLARHAPGARSRAGTLRRGLDAGMDASASDGLRCGSLGADRPRIGRKYPLSRKIAALNIRRLAEVQSLASRCRNPQLIVLAACVPSRVISLRPEML